MAVIRMALLAVLAATMAGCGASAASTTPSSSPVAEASASQAASPVDPSPAASSPHQTPAPTPTASATPKPDPAKPTGIRLTEQVEELCDPADTVGTCGVGDSTFTVTWSQPRSRDLEVRVYGVTKCFGVDDDGDVIDGWCLRERTPLPGSVRTLLGKAPASAGRLHFTVAQSDWYKTQRGVRVYAFVMAAYRADGSHSIFAIVDRAEYCRVADVACSGVDVLEDFAPGSWMRTIVADVRVRSEPGTGAASKLYRPLLAKGTEFSIERGPVVANGYVWYFVQLPSGALDGGITRGWLAAGSRDGEPWIENIGIDEG